MRRTERESINLALVSTVLGGFDGALFNMDGQDIQDFFRFFFVTYPISICYNIKITRAEALGTRAESFGTPNSPEFDRTDPSDRTDRLFYGV